MNFFTDITLRQLNMASALQNRAYILTKKPAQNGRIRVQIGERYSRI